MILQIETLKNAKSNLTMATIKTILKDLSTLKEQNAILNAVIEHCSSNFLHYGKKYVTICQKSFMFLSGKL